MGAHGKARARGRGRVEIGWAQGGGTASAPRDHIMRGQDACAQRDLGVGATNVLRGQLEALVEEERVDPAQRARRPQQRGVCGTAERLSMCHYFLGGTKKKKRKKIKSTKITRFCGTLLGCPLHFLP
jgi:hypothetical protein